MLHVEIGVLKSVNELMESKGGKKKSSSSKSFLYEAPLDYIIEDVRPNGGLERFKSADYSNVNKFPFQFLS
jgi:S-adenosylmethionine decarboxylase